MHVHDLSAMGAGQEERGGGKGRTSASPLGLHKTDLAGEVGSNSGAPVKKAFN